MARDATAAPWVRLVCANMRSCTHLPADSAFSDPRISNPSYQTLCHRIATPCVQCRSPQGGGTASTMQLRSLCKPSSWALFCSSSLQVSRWTWHSCSPRSVCVSFSTDAGGPSEPGTIVCAGSLQVGGASHGSSTCLRTSQTRMLLLCSKRFLSACCWHQLRGSELRHQPTFWWSPEPHRHPGSSLIWARALRHRRFVHCCPGTSSVMFCVLLTANDVCRWSEGSSVCRCWEGLRDRCWRAF